MTGFLSLLLCCATATAAHVDAAEDSILLALRDAQHNATAYAPCPSCPVFGYDSWSGLIRQGSCRKLQIQDQTARHWATIRCKKADGRKVFRFPAGIFEIHEQLLVPSEVTILGAANPNDMSEPKKTPDWTKQTLFLATRGVTDYKMVYCHAKDMVTTRVGFVLSSNVRMRDISYQGIDTIRPSDNGALCGGGAFETKGCAENDCSVSSVNNGGSDGQGVKNVTIDRIRINDFFFAEDSVKVGAPIPGNYDCRTDHWMEECCFCKPNGVRSTQLAVWVPDSRGSQGSSEIHVSNLVMRSSQADGINLHGKVSHATVSKVVIENTGDDTYALWGANADPKDIVFKDCAAINPGIMRPNWYGNCVATYGLKTVVFENISCEAASPLKPIQQPGSDDVMIDTSMFVFYTSFGGSYASGNTVCIRDWSFTDLNGKKYTPVDGSMEVYKPHKMVWTRAGNGVLAPFYLPSKKQQVNVKVCPRGDLACCTN